MSSHVFHEIYLHLNWPVKDNQPWLTPRIETAVHNFLRERCRQMKGVYLHEVGGTETHVHLAVNVEPFVTPSDMVRELKGGTSHDINTQERMKAVEWQRGYGIVSFGRKQLPWVVEYIRNQKQHHASGRVFDRLERTEFDGAEGDG